MNERSLDGYVADQRFCYPSKWSTMAHLEELGRQFRLDVLEVSLADQATDPPYPTDFFKSAPEPRTPASSSSRKQVAARLLGLKPP